MCEELADCDGHFPARDITVECRSRLADDLVVTWSERNFIFRPRDW